MLDGAWLLIFIWVLAVPVNGTQVLCKKINAGLFNQLADWRVNEEVVKCKEFKTFVWQILQFACRTFRYGTNCAVGAVLEKIMTTIKGAI